MPDSSDNRKTAWRIHFFKENRRTFGTYLKRKLFLGHRFDMNKTVKPDADHRYLLRFQNKLFAMRLSLHSEDFRKNKIWNRCFFHFFLAKTRNADIL